MRSGVVVGVVVLAVAAALGKELGDAQEFVAGVNVNAGWEAVPGSPGWENFPLLYWKDEVFVRMQGSVAPLFAANTSLPILTLGEGYRPSTTHRFVCSSAASDLTSAFLTRRIVVEVGVDGVVAVVDDGDGDASSLAVSSVSLDGVRFTWAYTNDLGVAADTADGLFSTLGDVGDDLVYLDPIAGFSPPQVYRDPATFITYFRGAGTLTRTDCADPKSGSCDLFLLEEDYVPIGFADETAVFPQVNDVVGSYLLFYPDSPNARGRLYKGTSGDVVYFDGIVLMPTGVELARDQPATQSSNADDGFAWLAVDGNTATDFADGSCVLTNTGATEPALATEIPWWRVDLGQSVAIDFLRITARSDCCGESLSGFEIRIGDSLDNQGNSNSLCGTKHYISQGATEDVSCSGSTGQYVNIRLTDLDYPLTFCEVQVFGTTAVSPSGQAMMVLTPHLDTLYGGWSLFAASATPRAMLTPDAVVCLAGRLSFTPRTQSFNMVLVGQLDQNWRPRYRTRQPVACYVAGVAASCSLLVEINGELFVTDGTSEPEPSAGSDNWVSLEGVCFNGVNFLARMEVEGSSQIDLIGGAHVFIGSEA